MFREMRRRKQVLPEADCLEILQRGTSGVLALLGDEDYPYAVPLSYVYEDGKLYFHSAKSGHKIDAIHNSDKASFCIIDKDQIVPAEYTTYFRSVIAFGKVRIIEDPEEKRHAIKTLGMKYSADYADGMDKEIDGDFNVLTMIELKIEHLSGKEAIELVRAKG